MLFEKKPFWDLSSHALCVRIFLSQVIYFAVHGSMFYIISQGVIFRACWRTEDPSVFLFVPIYH